MSDNTTPLVKKRCYKLFSVVRFDEDETHEFKAHRCMSEEEFNPALMTPTGQTAYKPCSRTLCGFLNAGRGGIVYLGIRNDGQVIGMRMSQYQCDHLLLNLDDTLQRYRPPVPRFLYSVNFSPVLQDDDPYPEELIPNLDETVRQKSHALRTHRKCWCEYHAKKATQYQCVDWMNYVIEIVIKPINIDDPQTLEWIKTVMPKAPWPRAPMFQAEDGQVYYRKTTSTVTYSFADVEDIMKEEVRLHHMSEYIRLRRKLRDTKVLLQAAQQKLKEIDEREEKKSKSETYETLPRNFDKGSEITLQNVVANSVLADETVAGYVTAPKDGTNGVIHEGTCAGDVFLHSVADEETATVDLIQQDVDINGNIYDETVVTDLIVQEMEINGSVPEVTVADNLTSQEAEANYGFHEGTCSGDAILQDIVINDIIDGEAGTCGVASQDVDLNRVIRETTVVTDLIVQEMEINGSVPEVTVADNLTSQEAEENGVIHGGTVATDSTVKNLGLDSFIQEGTCSGDVILQEVATDTGDLIHSKTLA